MNSYPNNQRRAPETRIAPNYGDAGYRNTYITPPPPKSKSNVSLIVICVIAALIICALLVYIFVTKSVDMPEEGVDIEMMEADGSDYEHQYDWLSERAVTASDLEGKTAGDLRLMKNAIYARHGYIFKSDDLKEYFEKYSWYSPKYADVNQYLSPLEQKNIAYITKYGGGAAATASKPTAASASKSSSNKLQNITFAYDYSDIVCYQKLTRADLAGLSKAELRILRNTIYARHGRKFKSADLRNYFNGFSWYNGVYDEVSPNSLSSVEKHNLSLIQSME